MYATEFQTIIKDSYIKIPEFERFKNREVKIIILEINQRENNKTQAEDFITKSVKYPKHIPDNIQFLTRDEANER